MREILSIAAKLALEPSFLPESRALCHRGSMGRERKSGISKMLRTLLSWSNGFARVRDAFFPGHHQSLLPPPQPA